MKEFILFALLIFPLKTFAKPISLDHFYTRVPSKTYSQIAADSRLIGSNLFYANMNQDRGYYKGHYLNGLESYFEIFDASKIDTMKYVDGVYVGLGFMSANINEFNALEKRVRKNVACDVTRLDFHPQNGNSHFLVCRKGGLRIHVFQFEPKTPRYTKVTRLLAAKRLRERAGYNKTPLADEIVNINIIATKEYVDIIGEMLKSLGWRQINHESKWKLKKQLVTVTVVDKIKHPKFESVFFSTTEKTKQTFRYPDFSITPNNNALKLEFGK